MSKAPKPANQGGVAKANVAPSRMSGKPSGGGKTPGLGSGTAVQAQAGRQKPVGGSGTTHSSPKPFRK